jgi:hypothetical protein
MFCELANGISSIKRAFRLSLGGKGLNNQLYNMKIVVQTISRKVTINDDFIMRLSA